MHSGGPSFLPRQSPRALGESPRLGSEWYPTRMASLRQNFRANAVFSGSERSTTAVLPRGTMRLISCRRKGLKAKPKETRGGQRRRQLPSPSSPSSPSLPIWLPPFYPRPPLGPHPAAAERTPGNSTPGNPWADVFPKSISDRINDLGPKP